MMTESNKKIKREIKISLEANEKENMTKQNLWDTLKSVLRGKFIALSAYIKRSERAQRNDLLILFNNLATEEQTTSNPSW